MALGPATDLVRPRRTRASGRGYPAQCRLSGPPHGEQPRTADTPGSSASAARTPPTTGVSASAGSGRASTAPRRATLSRGEHEHHGSSSCASRSATPARRIRPIWPATSPSRRGDRFLPTSMKRPRSAFRSRTPANQKPAASALRDYCRPRADGRDAADEPDRTRAAGLPHMRVN